MIGSRSKIVKENMPAIYLSDRISLPYWRMILNLPVLLRIDTSKLTSAQKNSINKYSYYSYNEYIMPAAIPPEAIVKSEINDKLSVPKTKKYLLSLIDNISDLCIDFAKYHLYKTNKKAYLFLEEQTDECANEYLNDSIIHIHSLQYMFPHLNWSVLSQKELYQHLYDMGNSGEYTMCDTYEYDHPKITRLWELLNESPYATKETKWLYHWIESNWKPYILTGGWML